MATFTNYATLSYNGGTTESNTVTGELLEVLSATKTAVANDYTAKDDVTYVISLRNSGAQELTNLTVTDDLGGYLFGKEEPQQTVYPLAYTAGSLRYYLDGVLQAAPAVAAGPPLVISGISVPAGGNALLIYEAATTNYAPLGSDAQIVNTATVAGDGIANPTTVSSVIGMEQRADLNVSKAICPATVAENGQVSYTFVIGNTGNIPATAADDVVLTDQFQPRLKDIAVTFNGTAWTEGLQYSYNEAEGQFATLPGRITVPAAAYTQKEDGTWSVTPGVSTLVVTGTI